MNLSDFRFPAAFRHYSTPPILHPMASSGYLSGLSLVLPAI
jgi:hypothetical protein